MSDEIIVRGARLHNLKNINVTLPKNKLVVFTGLSGSGKSSLAFDILHKEGARQYMESLGLVTDGMSKPPVEFISGLSPSISVDQHPGSHSPRSTVGTATEIFTYLRVLFARLGHRPCPSCGLDVPPSSFMGEASFEEDESEPDESQQVICPHCGVGLPELSMTHFSFNKPAGACPVCTGLGVVANLHAERCFDPAKGIADGGVVIWDLFNKEQFVIRLKRAGQYYGFEFDEHQPVGKLGEIQRDLLYYGVNEPEFKRHFPGVKPPPSVVKGYFEGVITNLKRRYAEGMTESGLSVKLDVLYSKQVCPACEGARLRLESRQVTVDGMSIIKLCKTPLEDVAAWLEALPAKLSAGERVIAEPVMADLRERLRRLVTIGVGYLTLERGTPTLSAGEGQRLRLAALLGSGLTGVLYVLDELTIGLHQRDTTRLIGILRQLRDLGNTVLVIEHDLEMIRAADHVVEFGPGAGKHGGQIVITGTPAEVEACPDSPTGAYLSGRERLKLEAERIYPRQELVIRGAREHNLKNLTVEIPLGRLVAVTGVSGSGKSSLIFDILDRAAQQRFYRGSDEPGRHDAIEGWQAIDRVVTVDQSAIGRMPRSNAATYTDTFTAIREVFAATPEARQRKMGAGHFSFNVPGGRCERCEGAGVLNVNMHFLPDVQVRCPVCQGRRFKKDVLSVRYRGVDIASVLDMTIEEAFDLFRDIPAAAARLKVMVDVGLGYLQLGQPATTLSGGEAQRVKLAKDLARGGSGRKLYLLDEPTTGLHTADVARLLTLLRGLVTAGNSVVVVEHHMELIRAVDWIIDLGPEGGDAGGEVLAVGTPTTVREVEGSYTGLCLKQLGY
ncbi:MAG TPA: excinuclease ABC subunit UvrA [Anaerolineaceae bacterium]|nr:excinuclease ABC subunit UvrA [Anaerolineaceae bacterium]HPN52873.1 excinuclease ABC subunit UvrA [Anaerolineaceae bacterium]